MTLRSISINSGGRVIAAAARPELQDVIVSQGASMCFPVPVGPACDRAAKAHMTVSLVERDFDSQMSLLVVSASSTGSDAARSPRTRRGTERATLTSHQGSVRTVAFCRDGSQLASDGGDGRVRLWDRSTSTERATLDGRQGTVNTMAFSPYGSLLASGGGGGDNTVRLWDPFTGTERATLDGHKEWMRKQPDVAGTPNSLGPQTEIGYGVTSVAYAPNGAAVAIGCQDGSVVLVPTQAVRTHPVVRLIGLRGSNWAVIHGEPRYELHGDSAGRFWWVAGLCRFEPGVEGRGQP